MKRLTGTIFAGTRFASTS